MIISLPMDWGPGAMHEQLQSLSPNSSFSGYLAGTPLARALESKDECLQAAAAALIPVHAILSARSQAKVAADAMDALKKLSGNSLTFTGMAQHQPCCGLLSHGLAATALYSRYNIFSVCDEFFGEGVCTVLQLNAPRCGLRSLQGVNLALCACRQRQCASPPAGGGGPLHPGLGPGTPVSAGPTGKGPGPHGRLLQI